VKWRNFDEKFNWEHLRARLTFLRTIFNALPIARPFLAPFKGQVATLADLGGKAVLGFSFHFIFFAR
jgi:hypothetical protein